MSIMNSLGISANQRALQQAELDEPAAKTQLNNAKSPTRAGWAFVTLGAEDTGLEPATGHPAIDFESTC